MGSIKPPSRVNFFIALSFWMFNLPIQAGSQSIIVINLYQFGSSGKGKINDHDAFRKAAEFINKRGGYVKLILPKGTYILGKQFKGYNQTNYFGVDLFFLHNCRNVTI